jgi:hypothetical protein
VGLSDNPTTRPKRISVSNLVIASISSQSTAATARSRIGAPVTSLVQATVLNRSDPLIFVYPPKNVSKFNKIIGNKVQRKMPSI